MGHARIVRVHAVTGKWSHLTNGCFVRFLCDVLDLGTFGLIQIIRVNHGRRIVTDITVRGTLNVFSSVGCSHVEL